MVSGTTCCCSEVRTSSLMLGHKETPCHGEGKRCQRQFLAIRIVRDTYAFSIWGLIFLLDAAYAIWQRTGERRRDATLDLVAPWAAAGLLLTTIWMPLFSQQLVWACLLVIFGALGCLPRCAVLLSPAAVPARVHRGRAWRPLPLHA